MKEEARKNLLIIFYRNPELGKVKTRLAATMGEAHALAIYWKLAGHTRTITENLNTDKVVCYSDYVDKEDNWPNEIYNKALQIGDSLGERMKNAFVNGFQNGYQSIGIIGTDCYTLTSDIISKGFSELTTHHTVIGPATDGGYYFLGTNHYHAAFFENKRWSTDTVAQDTISDFRRLNLTYFILPELNDVDTEEDLPPDLRTKHIQ